MIQDPLIDRCVDIFRATIDADYNDFEAMSKVFEYLSVELKPMEIDDPMGLWDDYMEGRNEVCSLLATQSKLHDLNSVN